ncbi:hypothetical protein GS467_13855 [Rhodococcus hoagii]|nr:hypothetical protein [Prescottella equi]NKS22282.1 hypothetical protein [Prescottella equi]
MDAGEILAAAWKAVETSGVPDHLHELAFTQAIEILRNTPLAGAHHVPQGTPQHSAEMPLPPVRTAPNTGEAPSDPDSEFYAKISMRTGVEVTQLEKLLHLEDGVPRIAIDSKYLPVKKKERQVLIAKIVLVARNIHLDEQEVSSAEIRKECEAYGLADGNLATNIKKLNSEDGLIVIGEKTNVKIKVRRTFIDKFHELIKQMEI